ncbi:MAG: transglutaminase domain-containing protein, partial [Calditrichaeota bacterium]|nr:transglutaminase domain-containing protein [Calditrichota bacterium]
EYLRVKARLRIAAFGEPTRDTPWQKFKGRCKVAASTATYEGMFTIHMVRTKGPGEWIRSGKGRFARELASEPDVQVSDSLIRRTARKIAGDARTPWEAVKRVCRWVATEIRYKLTGADALTCLKTREGDCGPKAKLAIAFLRSLGIPARIAGGLLYTGNRWGQHNWVEVYLGDALGWVPVDPTTDEADTFSAAHLTLWEGWAGALSSEPGEASIEVLEFRKAP